MSQQNDKTSNNWNVIGTIILNFFIWFVPGIVVFAISLIILLILLTAADTGLDVNIYKFMPKGLVSFFDSPYKTVLV